MKRIVFIGLLFFVLGNCGFAQQNIIDSLKNELVLAKQDTLKVLILSDIGRAFQRIDLDSTIHYAEKALSVSKKAAYKSGRFNGDLGHSFRWAGNFPKAFQYMFEGLRIATKERDIPLIGLLENSIAIVYSQLEDNPNAIIHQKKAIEAFEEEGNDNSAINSTLNLGRGYRRNLQFDSAAICFQKVYKELDTFKNTSMHAFFFMEMGQLEFQKNNHERAFEFLRESMAISEMLDNKFFNAFANNAMAVFFKSLNQIDSSIHYAENAYLLSEQINDKYNLLEAADLLADLYQSKGSEKANFYLNKVIQLNNELYGSKKVQELQKTLAAEQARQRLEEEVSLTREYKLKQYGFLAGLFFLVLVAFLLYRNNRLKHKDNLLLQKQKEEVEYQKHLAEDALSNLKSTQAQLIQSEKMASLGELTAGIAHEIQNPLNFVNNFSEVSEEMIKEIKDERLKTKDQRDEALEDEILSDIEQNLRKINHHGNRASSIVKGMLEHSRTSSGKKELIDINALADEYLRLAYHGLIAKEKSFNADFKTDFDSTLPKVEVVNQEMGRVLLNLINNAFQAVSEEREQRKAIGDLDYKPLVSIKTQLITNNQLQATITDNGSGIPDAIKDKIFQPFFTTKDTGKGTGLGLSLAYNIVKAHGGEIQVESVEGEGSEFKIILPI
jgi:signal transduction histidine kinase